MEKIGERDAKDQMPCKNSNIKIMWFNKMKNRKMETPHIVIKEMQTKPNLIVRKLKGAPHFEKKRILQSLQSSHYLSMVKDAKIA